MEKKHTGWDELSIIRDVSVKGKVRKLMEDSIEDTLSLGTGKGILKLPRLKQR